MVMVCVRAIAMMMMMVMAIGEHLLLTFCYKLKFEIANVSDMPKIR